MVDLLKNFSLNDFKAAQYITGEVFIFKGGFEHLTQLFQLSASTLIQDHDALKATGKCTEMTTQELEEALTTVFDGISSHAKIYEGHIQIGHPGVSIDLLALDFFIESLHKKDGAPLFSLKSGRNVYESHMYAMGAIRIIDEAVTHTKSNNIQGASILTSHASLFVTKAGEAQLSEIYGDYKSPKAIRKSIASQAGKGNSKKSASVRDFVIKIAMERMPGSLNPWNNKAHCIETIYPRALPLARKAKLSEDSLKKRIGEWLPPASAFEINQSPPTG